jgi:hypothetical protein
VPAASGAPKPPANEQAAVQATPSPSPTFRAVPPPRRTTPAVQDPAWEELRGRVKAAMTARATNIAALAVAIGRSEIAVRIFLGSRKPPRPGVQARLRGWLDESANGDAPAVAAADGWTFRSNGDGRAHASSPGIAD